MRSAGAKFKVVEAVSGDTVHSKNEVENPKDYKRVFMEADVSTLATDAFCTIDLEAKRISDGEYEPELKRILVLAGDDG